MTILNTIPITELTFFAILVIGIGVLCFAIMAGGAAANNSVVATVGAILVIVDFFFALISCLVFKVPFEEPTGRYKYEVTIEDIKAVRNYEIIEQRGDIYTIKELTEDELPEPEETMN